MVRQMGRSWQSGGVAADREFASGRRLWRPAACLLVVALLLLLTLDVQTAGARVDVDEGSVFLPIVQRDAPDPGKILYANQSQFAIYVISPDGGTPMPLTLGVGGLAVALNPAWSPDNSRIAFAGRSSDNDDADIWVMSANGRDHQRLTTDPGDEYGPVWSPDGGKIAFVRIKEAGTGDIFVMNADGSNPVNLTKQVATYFGVVWSPDGGKLAFGKDGDIFVVDANGSHLKNLSNHPAFDSDASWAPDGRRIVFTSGRGTNPSTPDEIVVVNADGSGLKNLTNTDSNDFGPAWSPDGSTIAFTGYRDDGWYLLLMNADGSNLHKITTTPAFYHRFSWSPDGSRLAFLNDWVVANAADALVPGIVIPITERDIGVIDANGTNLARLTFGDQDPSPPLWSN